VCPARAASSQTPYLAPFDFEAKGGQRCIGRFTLDDATGEAKAFDANGKTIGKFHGFKAGRIAVYAASRGISAARSTVKPIVDARKSAGAEARRRLEEPAAFVSGLPAGFLGR
jgi:hypothetical protein